MAEASMNTVVEELRKFNSMQEESNLMGELRDERSNEIEKSAEKRGSMLQSRIDYSNILLEKTKHGIGSLVKFFKLSDMQNAEDRRELMDALKNGVKIDKESSDKIVESRSDSDDSGGPGILGRMNDWIIALLGGSAIGSKVLLGASKIKDGFRALGRFIMKIDDFIKGTIKIITNPAKSLKSITIFLKGSGGKTISKLTGLFKGLRPFVGTLARFTGLLTVIIGVTSAIKGFLKGKEDGFFQGFQEGFIGLINGLFGWLLDLPFQLASWIAGKLGYENIAEVLGEVSFEKTFRAIMTSLNNVGEWFGEKFYEIFMDKGPKLIRQQVDSLIQMFTNLIESVKNIVSSLNPFSSTEEEKAEKRMKEIEDLQKRNLEHQKMLQEGDERFGFGNRKSRAEAIRENEERLRQLREENKEVSKSVQAMKIRPLTAAAMNATERELRESKQVSPTNIAVGGNTVNSNSKSSTIIMSNPVPNDGLRLNI